MQLLMYVGNDLIASIMLNRHSIAQPGYLGQIKRKLLDQHSEVLQMTASKPEFLIVDLSTSQKETVPRSK